MGNVREKVEALSATSIWFALGDEVEASPRDARVRVVTNSTTVP